MTGKPKIIVLAGPTATGKTAVAIDMARHLGAEIIGADSMQIYRYMDIGTAKPTPEERTMVPHHLIDIRDPDEPFDASQYTVAGREAIRDVIGREKIPMVVGGTGLYIKALLGGIFELKAADGRIRERLLRLLASEGINSLHARLQGCDPETAGRLHPNDTYRILRALETLETTGVPLTQLQEKHRFGDEPFQVLKIGLQVEREVLYERINRRSDAMMAEGFLEEVRSLLFRGFPEDLKSMQSIGYRHMVDYIRNRTSREEAIATMKRDTRRYAKRQMTWFNADPQFTWVAPSRIKHAKDIAEGFFRSP